VTKLNDVERVKLEKDGLAIIHDIEKLAKGGFASVEAGDIDRLKWLGLYLQRPKTDGRFLLRVKLPGGGLKAVQARALAAIATDYARGRVDITTRQAVQFHWLKVENLPDILARLAAVGLSTVEAAGDCPRNIVDSPLAGIDKDEVADTRPLVAELNAFFEGNSEFSNLPRKFKIAITGGVDNAIHAETNDVAFVPAVKLVGGSEVQGFNVLVGGGLSAKPRLATELDIFAAPENVVKVAAAVAALFRDYGYREKRNHARLKFLLEDWGIARFTAELLQLTGPLPGKGRSLTRGWNGGYAFGVNKQKQPGFNYLGLAVTAGRLKATELESLAAIAEKYGDGSLRTVNSQNVVVPNVPDEKIAGILAEELLRKFMPRPESSGAHVVACTGKELCPLAVAETKGRVKAIAEYVDRHVTLKQPVRFHISGCVNSCGQHQIADIGLQGAVVKAEGQLLDAFELWIGGVLGPGARLATKLKGTVPAAYVAAAIVHLLKFYQADGAEGEAFSEFAARVGVLELQARLDEFLASDAGNIDKVAN
jgi:ferredoxin-nitrite reductase